MTAAMQVQETTEEDTVTIDISDDLEHAIYVSNLAYEVAREMSLDEDTCYQLALAGMLHDIGKLKLSDYIYGTDDESHMEEMRQDRMHSQLGYEILKNQGYSQFILECILYHHENDDGSGYPGNLRGDDIPLGARILHVCDVFAAFMSDRPYREGFDLETAMELMIEEIRHFDMEVFLAFQRVVHK